jgi:tetratricopeptide (TPR) repeat protein
MGKFRESIASAERAIALRPGYAEAFNNVAAGHNALGEWAPAIAAAENALRLNPALQIAQNNLSYARAQDLKR